MKSTLSWLENIQLIMAFIKENLALVPFKLFN